MIKLINLLYHLNEDIILIDELFENSEVTKLPSVTNGGFNATSDFFERNFIKQLIFLIPSCILVKVVHTGVVITNISVHIVGRFTLTQTAYLSTTHNCLTTDFV